MRPGDPPRTPPTPPEPPTPSLSMGPASAGSSAPWTPLLASHPGRHAGAHSLRPARTASRPRGALPVTPPCILTLLLVAATAVANHQGDEWTVLLTDEENSAEIRWTAWAPWPTTQNQSRITNLTYEWRGQPQPNATLTLTSLSPTEPVWLVNVTSPQRSWEATWTWVTWDGCDHGIVIGTLTTPLQGVVGPGLADETGPGPDGHYECHQGGFLRLGVLP